MKTRPALIPKNRWLAYLSASLATVGAGVLPAEGEIHYSGQIDLKLDGMRFSTNVTEPLTGSANLSFRRGQSGGGAEFDYVIANAKTAAFRAASADGFLAQKLRSGAYVSSGKFGAQIAALIEYYGRGKFARKGEGFTGFYFDVGKGKQYGWERIKTIKGGTGNKLEVIDYAWADPGEPIRAGQTSEDSEVAGKVPDAGSLGALAFGGTGLLVWRRRRERARLGQVSS